MKDRWYKWYPIRYQQKTMHLTLEQDALYRRLIDHYMVTGDALPNNEAALARISGVPLDKFHEIFPALLPFFTKVRDILKLKRCETNLNRFDATRQKKAEAGRAGGLAKAKKQACQVLLEPQPVEKIDNPSICQKPVVAEENRIEEKREESNLESVPNTERELSRLEAGMYFSRLWEAFPAWSGKEGGFTRGAPCKGSRQKAEQKFYILLKKEKDHERFTQQLIHAAYCYSAYLDHTQWLPSCHLTTWLNQERWKIDYTIPESEGGGTMLDAIAEGVRGALHNLRDKD